MPWPASCSPPRGICWNDPPTPEEDDRLIHLAHASRYHWEAVGTDLNRAIGEWKVSRVYATLGRGEPAVFHARRCLHYAGRGNAEAWMLASAHEGLARALAVSGDLDAAWAAVSGPTRCWPTPPTRRIAAPTTGATIDETGLGDPVATRSWKNEANKYSLTIYPLNRDGETVILHAMLSYDTVDGVADTSVLAWDDRFSAVYGRPNGFKLIDTKRKIIYAPATTSDTPESAVCSPDLTGSRVTGDAVMISCVFLGPDPAATELDVQATVFGTYRHVPVQ